MRILLFLVIIVQFSVLLAQTNITQVGYLDLNTLHDQNLNDVWGYEDENGNPYVLVGGTKGTSVVSIQDPSNPTEVFYEVGMESIWRDIKTWGDHAYVTTEALNGLLIIDMTPLPASTILSAAYYTGEVGSEWQSAHNIYIDESGYAYIFGANRGNGGVIILDVHTDPLAPIEVGQFDNWYTHDGYVRNDTLFCAHVEEGFMSVVDITDKANPQLLGTINTPSLFTHNVWTKQAVAFTTDEVSGGFIAAYDISDPANMVELDRIQSSPGLGVIPHNVHVLGDYLVTSYYSDGVVIHDATYPYNLIEVASFDTYPGQTASYDGCWGVYPFFSNGLLAATDITEGLFILNPNLNKAAYMEGVVTEFGSGNPINGVSVRITGLDHEEQTSVTGFYSSGVSQGGSKEVICSKVGYYPDTSFVSLINDQVTIHNVELTPIPPFSLSITVKEEGSLMPISDVMIELKNGLITHTGLTNGIGQEDFSLFYEDVYSVKLGKWGYVTYCNDLTIDASTGSLEILLPKGYYDDFTFDFGWTTTSTATTGDFIRAEPMGTSGGAQTDFDVTSDCGAKCYVSGNSSQLHPDVDDIDDGTITLRSPVMDLTSYSDPYINFSKWFYCFYGPFPPDDSLKVFMDNGLSGPVLIDLTISDETLFYQWLDVSVRISDFLTTSSTMQLIVEASDLPGAVNVTEAAFDHFYIVDAIELGLMAPEEEVVIYPNPTQTSVTIKGLSKELTIVDQTGRVVFSRINELSDELKIDVSSWASGVYILRSNGIHHKFIVEK